MYKYRICYHVCSFAGIKLYFKCRFEYLSAILNPVVLNRLINLIQVNLYQLNFPQGIFIFILYVVCNDNLKKIWKKLLGISGHDDKRSHTSLPYSKSKGRLSVVCSSRASFRFSSLIEKLGHTNFASTFYYFPGRMQFYVTS